MTDGTHMRGTLEMVHDGSWFLSGVSWAQSFSLIYTSGSRHEELGFPESSASLKSPKKINFCRPGHPPALLMSLWIWPGSAQVPRDFSLMFPLWDIFRWNNFSPAHLSLQCFAFKTEHFQMFYPLFSWLPPKKRVLFAFSTTEFWPVCICREAQRGKRHKSSQSAAAINVDKWIKFVTGRISPSMFCLATENSSIPLLPSSSGT